LAVVGRDVLSGLTGVLAPTENGEIIFGSLLRLIFFVKF
jgi:hypothetical protein